VAEDSINNHIDVLTEDSDPDGALMVTVASNPLNGTGNGASDGLYLI
jgi:hypothetical protein